MYGLTDREEVSRGMLARDQVMLLDEILTDHGLPESSPYKVLDNVAWVCLLCGSVGVSSDNESRDYFVDNFTTTCCGLTVNFHSDYKVLNDPKKLVLVRRGEN